MAATAAVIGAVAAVASAGTGIAGAAGAFGGKSPKMPSTSGFDVSGLARLQLPGAKANAAANVGGGMAPDFLKNFLEQQTGAPGAGTDVLDDIRKSLGSGGVQAP